MSVLSLSTTTFAPAMSPPRMRRRSAPFKRRNFSASPVSFSASATSASAPPPGLSSPELSLSTIPADISATLGRAASSASFVGIAPAQNAAQRPAAIISLFILFFLSRLSPQSKKRMRRRLLTKFFKKVQPSISDSIAATIRATRLFVW